MAEQVKVIKDEVKPEPDEVIAAHIIEIARAMQRLGNGRLKRDTIVLLVHDRTKIARRDINLVLDCLEMLERIYVKPEVPRGKA
jgi:hypothetical protein